jgi:hypothetical protein
VPTKAAGARTLRHSASSGVSADGAAAAAIGSALTPEQVGRPFGRRGKSAYGASVCL